MAAKISTVTKIDTKYNADSVEWCPYNTKYVACGTYQLIEGETVDSSKERSSENNSRIGSINLYKYNESLKTVTEVQNISTCAITDMKWMTIDNVSLLAITGSSGNIDIYRLQEHDNVARLQILSSLKVCSSSLTLSLDWGVDNQMHNIAISDSKGCVTVVNVRDHARNIVTKQTWKAHNFDAWIAAFDRKDVNIVFSGGDDCLLKAWDLRTGCYSPIFVNKQHTMGVCAIQSSPLVEYVFASGSYDETVNIWDRRSMKVPLSCCNVYGGVWRLKWNPQKANYLLAACCHSGFHVLSIDAEESFSTKIVASYIAHESLAYGADWGITSEDVDTITHAVIGTCSFYDHRFDVWELSTL